MPGPPAQHTVMAAGAGHSMNGHGMEAPRQGDVSCSPTWVQPSADGAKIFVACNKSSDIVEIDVASWALTRRLPAGNGIYNLSVTRDDGQTAMCSACLTVRREYPMVSSVTPSVVREGTRTLRIDGQFLQRVTRVTTSSRKVKVKSFTNNADGTVSVRVVIDGGSRKTYTLTLTRDDGQTFTVDFSVRG